MDNFKCLTAFGCDLYKNDTNASIDFVDACENLCKELYKSMKIAKKFKEELKLANLEKEKLIVRLDESNKKNEFLRNQLSSQDEKKKKAWNKSYLSLKLNLKNFLLPSLLLITDLFLFSLNLKLEKSVFFLSRGIIKKMLILLC